MDEVLIIRRVSYSNHSSFGMNVVFTDGTETLISNVNQKLAEAVLTHGKIFENVGRNIIVAERINENNFLPIGDCHFFSRCGNIENLPGIKEDMWEYLLCSPKSRVKDILDCRSKRPKSINPEIVGLFRTIKV